MVTRQRKDKAKAAKVVWRISAAAPLGEYVRISAAAPLGEHVNMDPETAAEDLVQVEAEPKADEAPREVPERGWHHSTHELTHGMDISEETLDTLPNELIDLFFKKKP